MFQDTTSQQVAGTASKRSSRHSLRRKDTLTTGKEQYGGLYDDWIETAGLGTYIPSPFQKGASSRVTKDNSTKTETVPTGTFQGQSIPLRKKPVLFGGISTFSNTSGGSDSGDQQLISNQQPKTPKSRHSKEVDIVLTPRVINGTDSIMSSREAMTSSSSSLWHQKPPSASPRWLNSNAVTSSPKKVKMSSQSPRWLSEEGVALSASSFQTKTPVSDRNAKLQPSKKCSNGYVSSAEQKKSVNNNRVSLELRGNDLKPGDNRSANEKRIKAKMTDLELL